MAVGSASLSAPRTVPFSWLGAVGSTWVQVTGGAPRMTRVFGVYDPGRILRAAESIPSADVPAARSEQDEDMDITQLLSTAAIVVGVLVMTLMAIVPLFMESEVRSRRAQTDATVADILEAYDARLEQARREARALTDQYAHAA